MARRNRAILVSLVTPVRLACSAGVWRGSACRDRERSWLERGEPVRPRGEPDCEGACCGGDGSRHTAVPVERISGRCGHVQQPARLCSSDRPKFHLRPAGIDGTRTGLNHVSPFSPRVSPVLSAWATKTLVAGPAPTLTSHHLGAVEPSWPPSHTNCSTGMCERRFEVYAMASDPSDTRTARTDVNGTAQRRADRLCPVRRQRARWCCAQGVEQCSSARERRGGRRAGGPGEPAARAAAAAHVARNTRRAPSEDDEIH